MPSLLSLAPPSPPPTTIKLLFIRITCLLEYSHSDDWALKDIGTMHSKTIQSYLLNLSQRANSLFNAEDRRLAFSCEERTRCDDNSNHD